MNLMSRKKRSPIVYVAVGTLLVVGVISIGGYYSEKSKDEESELSVKDDVNVRSMTRSGHEAGKRRTKYTQADYDAIFADILARYPELEPEWRSVPDEKNGFLQWLLFCENLGDKGAESPLLDLPEEVKKMLDTQYEWDPVVMKAFFDENQEMIAELVRIGLLEEQSSKGISTSRFDGKYAGTARQCGQILCAGARLAAEEGDYGQALTVTQAALGLARHQEMESPTFVSASVSTLLHLTVRGEVVENILPAMKLTETEYAQWQERLMRRPDPPLANLVKGEFWAVGSNLLVPGITKFLETHNKEIPDMDAFYDAFAKSYVDVIPQIDSASMLELWINKEVISEPEIPTALSNESKELYAGLIGNGNVDAWNGYANQLVRSEARYRYYDAAFAILAGKEPVNELLTDLPFEFDPETRILSFPDDSRLDGLGIKELRLP